MSMLCGSGRRLDCGSGRRPGCNDGGPEWKDDSHVDDCERCGMAFHLLVRRHHCRFCGGVFCRVCTASTQILVCYGYVDPVRVCVRCNSLIVRCQEFGDSVFRNELAVTRKMLADKIYNVNSYTGLFPPLYSAVKYGYVEMARLLISAGANVNFALPASTAFGFECPFCHRTTAKSKEETLRTPTAEFLCLNCDTFSVLTDRASLDHTGFAPLHTAVKRPENREAIDLLVHNKAQLDALTRTGYSPLLMAARCGHGTNVKALLRHAVKLNLANATDHENALHKAVRSGSAECVKDLLDAGIDSSQRNVQQQTATDLARELGYDHLRQLLN